MSFFGDSAVRTGNCVVLWDGITQPETKDGGGVVHSLKVACMATAPEVAELQQIATTSLNESADFKGALPPGGCWPVNNCDPAKMEGKIAGMVEFNAKSHKGAPQVFDANGQLLDPMQYNAMLYPGAVVQVLVHAFSFNNKSKGIAYGLDGIMIIDATAPRLPVPGAVDAAAAFGAVAGQPGALPPVAGQPGALPPVAGAPGALPPVAGAPGALPPVAGQPGALPPPHTAILTPPGGVVAPTMTAAANGIPYADYIAQGWNDEQLRTGGYIV